MNTWNVNGDERKCPNREIRQTYHWRNLSHQSKQEPKDTLPKGKCISRTMTSKNRYRTCLQRTRARPNLPPCWQRRRNKPTSIMRSKPMSVTGMAMRLGTVCSRLRPAQVRTTGTHTARSCGWDKNMLKSNGN